MNSPSPISAQELADLKEKAQVVSNALFNLACAVATFEGITHRLRRGNVAGPGARALNIIIYDAMHLIAIRTNALIISGSHATDASLKDLVDGLGDQALCTALINQARDEHLKKRKIEHIRKAKRNFALINASTAKEVRTLRNKMLAHTTTHKFASYTDAQNVIQLAKLVLRAGEEVYALYCEASFDYHREMRSISRSAGHLVALMRSTPEERLRRASIMKNMLPR